MSKTLDEMYLTWLYRQAGSGFIKPNHTYWSLFRLLYNKEYVWLIPNDDNRAEDGRDLRNEFADVEAVDDPSGLWMGLGCSMLELLVGLSRRLSFETDIDSRDWFYEFLVNLGLDSFHDGVVLDEERINETLDKVIWRIYEANGCGGLFPLEKPKEDQRDIELWYQMSSYLLEKGY